MNKNRFLADVPDNRQLTDYKIFGAREDGSLYFNSMLLEIAVRPDTPYQERINYLYIAYKNVLELFSRMSNVQGHGVFRKIYLYALQFTQEINRILEQYPIIRPNGVSGIERTISYPVDISNPELQHVLDLTLNIMVGYKQSDLQDRWIDGVRLIPIQFHRDFRIEYELNNLDLWCEDQMWDMIRKINSSKLRIVTAWVSHTLNSTDLNDIRVRLRKIGLFPIFMNIDLLNAVNSRRLGDEMFEKYPEFKSEYTYLDYFETTEPRYIRTPYESFDEVIDFYHQASVHPDVKNIYISLYRATLQGALLDTLIQATLNGKNLYAYIEPTARGDEENNLRIISRLKHDCDPEHLIIRCSYCGMKVHAKMGLVECNDGSMICHMGTGNLNEETAKIYTDFHVISREEEDIIQVIEAFKALATGIPVRQKIKETLIQEIRCESALGEEGRIALKCNHSVDEDLIYELKMAAQCGCSIKMVTRTSLGVMPQDIGADVSSVVGQLLEHERIYCFGNEDHIRAYLSSSDLMFRNLYKRMEILFRIKDSELAWELMKEIWFD